MPAVHLVWGFVAALAFAGFLTLLVYVALLRLGLSADRAASIAVPTWPAFVVAMFTVALWQTTKEQVEVTKTLASLEEALFRNRLQPHLLVERLPLNACIAREDLRKISTDTKVAVRFGVGRIINLHEAPAFVESISWTLGDEVVHLGPTFVPPVSVLYRELYIEKESTSHRDEEFNWVVIQECAFGNLFKDDAIRKAFVRGLRRLAKLMDSGKRNVAVTVAIPKRADMGELLLCVRNLVDGTLQPFRYKVWGRSFMLVPSKSCMLVPGPKNYEECKGRADCAFVSGLLEAEPINEDAGQNSSSACNF